MKYEVNIKKREDERILEFEVSGDHYLTEEECDTISRIIWNGGDRRKAEYPEFFAGDIYHKITDHPFTIELTGPAGERELFVRLEQQENKLIIKAGNIPILPRNIPPKTGVKGFSLEYVEKIKQYLKDD